MSELLQHLSDGDQAGAPQTPSKVRHLHSCRVGSMPTVEEIFEEEDNSDYSDVNSEADSEGRSLKRTHREPRQD